MSDNVNTNPDMKVQHAESGQRINVLSGACIHWDRPWWPPKWGWTR